jgi:putative NADH-flavin reductase
VTAALEAGHNVKAGIHHTNHLSNHPNLLTQTCDATSLEDLRKLLQGQDAVMSLIGHVHGSDATVQSTAIAQIIRAMNELQMKRIVSLTGSGVRFPGDKISLLDRILNSSITFIDPKRIQDGIHHAELLQASSMDWTIIRVLKLTNGAGQPFSLTEYGPTKSFVSRKTVAKAALRILEQQIFVRQAPMISKADR